MKPKYKRIILKLSGEALAGEKGFGLDEAIIETVVDQLIRAHEMGVEIGIVLGGGNFWRGRQGTNMDRTTADHMGMLATVINSLAMQDAIEQKGVPVRVQTALNMISVAEPFILRKALRHFELGRIVIFACGTGNPYCSTDTGAALRAAETARLERIVLGCMTGKLFKYACGDRNTHAANTKLDLTRLEEFGVKLPGVPLEKLHTTGELAAHLTPKEFRAIQRRLHEAALRLLSGRHPGIRLEIALYDDRKEKILS